MTLRELLTSGNWYEGESLDVYVGVYSQSYYCDYSDFEDIEGDLLDDDVVAYNHTKVEDGREDNKILSVLLYGDE